jgi:hypothetical protein
VLSPWSKPGRGASGISPPNTGADVANEAPMVPEIDILVLTKAN